MKDKNFRKEPEGRKITLSIEEPRQELHATSQKPGKQEESRAK